MTNMTQGLISTTKNLPYFEGTVREFSELYMGKSYPDGMDFTRDPVYKACSELFRQGCANGSWETSGRRSKSLREKHSVVIKILSDNCANKIYRVVNLKQLGQNVMDIMT